MKSCVRNKIITTIIASMVVALSYAQDLSNAKFYVFYAWNDSTEVYDSLCVLCLCKDSEFIYISREPSFPLIDVVSRGIWEMNNDTLTLYSDRKYITHSKMQFSGKLDYYIHWEQYNGLEFVQQTDSLIVCKPFQDAKYRRVRHRNRTTITLIKSNKTQGYVKGKIKPYWYVGKVDVNSVEWMFHVMPYSAEIEKLIRYALEVLDD